MLSSISLKPRGFLIPFSPGHIAETIYWSCNFILRLFFFFFFQDSHKIRLSETHYMRECQYHSDASERVISHPMQLCMNVDPFSATVPRTGITVWDRNVNIIQLCKFTLKYISHFPYFWSSWLQGRRNFQLCWEYRLHLWEYGYSPEGLVFSC